MEGRLASLGGDGMHFNKNNYQPVTFRKIYIKNSYIYFTNNCMVGLNRFFKNYICTFLLDFKSIMIENYLLFLSHLGTCTVHSVVIPRSIHSFSPKNNNWLPVS